MPRIRCNTSHQLLGVLDGGSKQLLKVFVRFCVSCSTWLLEVGIIWLLRDLNPCTHSSLTTDLSSTLNPRVRRADTADAPGNLWGAHTGALRPVWVRRRAQATRIRNKPVIQEQLAHPCMRRQAARIDPAVLQPPETNWGTAQFSVPNPAPMHAPAPILPLQKPLPHLLLLPMRPHATLDM